MGIIPAQKIKYNLHQMKKKLYIKRHKLTQKNLYTTIERSRRSNVYTPSSHCQLRKLGKTFLKPEYFVSRTTA
jgi:hypothetical protein